jgi:hypothetical protein
MAASCARHPATALHQGPAQRAAEGAVLAIVEHKDASAAQREIREVYTGIMAAPTALLKRWVMALKNDNVQKEFYLTDVVAMAVAEGVPVVATAAPARPRCWASTAPCSWPTWNAATSAAGRAVHGSRRAPGRPGPL